MDSRTMIGALALVVVLAGTVRGETWYFTGDENASANYVNAFADPTKWIDGNENPATTFNAADTYVLTNFGPGELSATIHGIRTYGGGR